MERLMFKLVNWLYKNSNTKNTFKVGDKVKLNWKGKVRYKKYILLGVYNPNNTMEVTMVTNNYVNTKNNLFWDCFWLKKI